MTSLYLALGLAMLDIQGDSTCPTPAEVGQFLATLGSGREAISSGQEPHAYLSADGEFVSIELLAPDGGLLAERRLERTAPCAEMAEAVAVILAAWQAKFTPALATVSVSPPPVVVAAPPPKVEPRPPLAFDVGLAVLTSIVGGEAVLGAKAEGSVFPFAIPLALHGAWSASSSHTQPSSSPPIDAQWMRSAVSLGPALRWRGRTAMLDVHADSVLALLRVRGAGLPQASSDTAAQFGLGAGLRGLWTWDHGAAWLGADLFAYPGQDHLTVANYGEVGRLPHLEVQIALGIGLGRFR